MSTGSRRLLFWGPTLIALALRVVHLIAMRDNPLFDRPIMDALMHDKWARGLLEGTWPGDAPFFRAPLYPYLLGALYALFDAQRLPVQLVHALISSLGAGWAALAATGLWGRRAGWAAGLLMAGLWTSIYFSAELLIVTVSVTLNLLAVALLVGSGGRPSARAIAGAGLVLGLSAIARPNILIVLPVVLWYLGSADHGRHRWRDMMILLVGVILPILPVTVHNVVKGHDTVLIASQGGVNFYIGNNPESDGRTAIVPGTRPTWQGGFDDAVAMAERDAGRKLKPSAVDRYFLRKGLAYWTEDPLGALALTGAKLRMLIGAGERSNNKFIYAWREWSPILKWPVLPGWPLVLVLAVLGLSRVSPRTRGRGLVMGMVAMYALSLLLFFVNARFRLPVAALLTIPAGAGVDLLISSIRARRWSSAAWVPAVALGLLAISLLDLTDFRERRTDANPFHAFTLGNAWADMGRTDEAIAAYQTALTIQERHPQHHFDLISDNLHRSYATMLVESGQPEEGIRVVQRWVQAQPSSAEARLWLGNLLLETGRIDEASAQFEFVLRAEPTNSGARLGKAWILYNNGQSGSALLRFQSLVRGTDGERAGFGAGLCLIALERWGEAERAFLEVLKKNPDSWQAWGNLAGIYERNGYLDKARDSHEALLRIKPDELRSLQWLRSYASGR